MMDQLDELYREVILEHFKNSSHSGELLDAQIQAVGSNPLCGDEVVFYLKLREDRITQARFTGKGCAISQAACYMLAATLAGKTLADVARVIEAMKALMQGQAVETALDLGDLEALAGVRKFPVRVKCAALSWNVIEQGVKSYQA